MVTALWGRSESDTMSLPNTALLLCHINMLNIKRIDELQMEAKIPNYIFKNQYKRIPNNMWDPSFKWF